MKLHQCELKLVFVGREETDGLLASYRRRMVRTLNQISDADRQTFLKTSLTRILCPAYYFAAQYFATTSARENDVSSSSSFHRKTRNWQSNHRLLAGYDLFRRSRDFSSVAAHHR